MAPALTKTLASTSSVKPEEDCPSTLRARLRDETPATSSSVKSVPCRNIYQEVHASLGNNLDDPKRDTNNDQAPESNDPATQLREAYAQMGLSLHTSATEHLARAHTEVQIRTKLLADDFSETLAQSKELYANIAYPLSATLCQSPDYLRESIAAHLNRLKQDIAAAREEILRLNTEWEECCRTEEEAWNEFKKGFDDHGKGATDTDKEAKKAADNFKKEAKAIVDDKCRLLDQVDEDFKQKIQEETANIMQSLFADL